MGHPGARPSHEAIYQYIYAERRDLIRYLVRHNRIRRCRGHSRKHRQSHIPNRVSIAAVRKAIQETLGVYPLDIRQTITYGNAHENVEPDDRIAKIEVQLNSRPRKCLAYRTPYEEFRRLKNVALAG